MVAVDQQQQRDEDQVARSRAVLAQVPDVQVPQLILLAREHGVEAWLAAAAPDRWPVDVRQALRAQRQRFLATTTRQSGLLQQLAVAFAAAQVPWVLLKGRSIADHAYPRPDLRFGVDLDVLVAPSTFADAVDAASSLADLIDVNWPLLRRLQVGQLRFASRAGVVLDLHWHLFNAAALRRRFDLPSAPMLERSIVSDDGRYRRLAPIDQLIHVAVHASSSGGNKLGWLVDIDRLVRSAPVDWPELVAAARAAKAGAAVALVMSRSRRALGTPVPAQLLRELAGKSWRYCCVLSEVGSHAGLGHHPSSASLSRAVARASGRGTAGSTLTLVGNGLQFMTTRRFPSGSVAPWLDPREPASAMFAVASAPDRDAYLAGVSAQS